ncbi:Nucleotide-sugar transporter [Ostreococcus tauri]|uniref:Nucleotide-sugar transporter n=1 Tax=Ostreococcus tauri TaxID=70448 RepID=A0A090M1C7_OSTTA|nr:Nucleotide-sugar transporter [Ostreococcus tauri]CEF97991.1 Nucleotide-sugar transporter [Ostreococcus tauri]|eukprot:XP_022839016.1 Nucleotide-sugar transporter [Ostreococcus tauri]
MDRPGVRRPRRARALGVALCAALAMQCASAPALRARFARGVGASAMVLATESVKATMSALALALSGRGRRERARLFERTFMLAATAPSAVYAAQNVLLARGAAGLDGTTYNCLNQTKIVSAAVFLYALRGHRQSLRQMVALVMVVCAGGVLSAVEGGGVDARTTGGGATAAACVLAASALSGLSGALCQMALQGGDVMPATLTLAMALTGGPMVLGGEYLRGGARGAKAIFDGWTRGAMIPAFSGAIGGVLVGEITKRMGSIAKGFAVTCGLVLTGFLQSFMDGRQPPTTNVACLLVIVAASVLHSTSPPKTKAKMA